MRESGGAVLYGHPRSSAIEWAKEDKFECMADESVVVYEQMVISSPKPDLSGLQSVKGIHVGGDITEEFEKAGKEMWCKHCGSLIGAEPHLPSCPTLKSKL